MRASPRRYRDLVKRILTQRAELGLRLDPHEADDIKICGCVDLHTRTLRCSCCDCEPVAHRSALFWLRTATHEPGFSAIVIFMARSQLFYSRTSWKRHSKKGELP